MDFRSKRKGGRVHAVFELQNSKSDTKYGKRFDRFDEWLENKMSYTRQTNNGFDEQYDRLKRRVIILLRYNY